MYVKLFSTLLDSTVWVLPDHVLRVWLTLLLTCDKRGDVEIPIPGIARRANVGYEEAKDAIRILESPDEDSKSREAEGRRIIRTAGDAPMWRIVNYEKYRNIKDAENRRAQNAAYQKSYRDRQKDENSKQKSNDVSTRKHPSVQAEGEAEGEAVESSSSKKIRHTRKPRKSPGGEEPKPTNPDVKTLLFWYASEFQRVRGTAMLIRRGRDGAAMQSLLAGRSLDEAKWMVTEFLQNPPDFYKDKPDPKYLLSCANEILTRKSVPETDEQRQDRLVMASWQKKLESS
jgi:hypothetical protein